MQRNAAHSQERILDAAFQEFAAHGIAGARVDRIAAQAGCNKNLIYIYFESKDQLFKTVLERQLGRVYDDIAFTPDDLPGYAGRVFDLAMTRPDLMRLLAWANLEAPDATAPRSRTAGQKLNSLAEGHPGAFPPGFILVTVVSLATAWSAANPFGRVYDPDATDRPEQLRAHIMAAVAAIAGQAPHARRP